MVFAVFFGQLIFGKIVEFVASRGQILRLKCSKFYFGCGSAPAADSTGELAIAWRERRGRGRVRKGWGEEERER